MAQSRTSVAEGELNQDVNDLNDVAVVDARVYDFQDLLGHYDLQTQHCHASVERYIEIKVFEYMDLALLTSAREMTAFCTFSAFVGNFHYQTCPQPLDPTSSNFPCPDYLNNKLENLSPQEQKYFQFTMFEIEIYPIMRLRSERILTWLPWNFYKAIV